VSIDSIKVFALGRLRRRLFGIPERATRFDRRGFTGGTPASRARIAQIGATFAAGYHAALLDTDAERLEARLAAIAREQRGFAYEGAAMALVLLDLLLPRLRAGPGPRFAAFLAGPGEPHAYMLHVGAGWALARLPWPVEANLGRFDPLLGALALDGYGFHQGYFHWRRFVAGQEVPRLSANARRPFDQGLGRSLWFVQGAEPVRIAETITAFDAGRREDLWSGVGLAAAYAGGVEAAELARLRESAAADWRALAQGAAFAAKARERAGNPAAHTELACRILCGCAAASAAAVTDQVLAALPSGPEPAYARWRQGIARSFATTGEPAQV